MHQTILSYRPTNNALQAETVGCAMDHSSCQTSVRWGSHSAIIMPVVSRKTLANTRSCPRFPGPGLHTHTHARARAFPLYGLPFIFRGVVMKPGLVSCDLPGREIRQGLHYPLTRVTDLKNEFSVGLPMTAAVTV
jgi:hypothetical protein